ncbi:thrombospondin type 3 repeat-containing protein [Winogradskyella maritima]|uniref:PA domain-containing protein n=1 Tax=Winogradskyella maritima TaxID=1517766 RepID=A0ABV8AFD7_9FLAO|nr:thrombospondin type 3 repeat-containing protein [Winogradskyella maritima]
MKKKALIFASFALVILFVLVWPSIFFNENTESPNKSNDDIVNLHNENLKKSPYKDRLKLSKKERKAQGLPPNRYYEEEFELTMNPIFGRPTFENLKNIRDYINQQRLLRTPGETTNTAWESRGPNNVGGRTRAVIFDRNDPSNETVLAGGVSGGLWRNTQISSASSAWTRVDIPSNLNVTVLAQDPNNFDIIYAGTGESYVSGDVNGDGVWKSEDGGETWNQIFGGISGDTTFESASNITVNSPNTIAGDYSSIETNSFGGTVNSTITADFVLADDTSGEATEGCTVFGADVSGKIALIRRGNCPFVAKVKNAQDAGAIAAIVLNNVPGSPINMAGTDNTITIPAVMISKADGDLIEAALASGVVNGSLNPATGDFTGTLVHGIQHINDIKIKDNNGVSEIYIAAGESIYGDANVPTFLGGPELGLYKSVDNGISFNEVNVPLTSNGNKHEPNDIEIGADGKIWMSTTRSSIYGEGGGQIFSSEDGENFTLAYSVPGGIRTQIAVSSQNAGNIYVLAQINGGVRMERTSDGFVSGTVDMALPDDADDGIPPNDFTRGQAFYDLVLEVDPTSDQILYAGGIDLFRSDTRGSLWLQISKWSNNNNLASLNVPLVHADQHAVTFANNDNQKILFGTDGGVYYSGDRGQNIASRELGFITSQFYTVGVAPTAAFTGNTDHFIGGLQDNGTQLFDDVDSGINSSSTAFGGDGAYSFFDQDGSDQYYITNFVFNRIVRSEDLTTGQDKTINSEDASNGSFINPQALDSNLDILYSNYSSGANSIIRRYSNVKPGVGSVTRTDLTDPLLQSRPTAMNVSPYTTDNSTLLVGTLLGNILIAERANSSPTWRELDADNQIIGSISDVEFGANEDEIFVSVHNYGVQNIWYTNNGGVNWQAKEGDLPDLPVKAVLQNPLNPNEVIIGTELGVWFTSNFGDPSPNWLPAMNGMSNVRVTDMDLRDDNMVFVSTYGRGVFSGQFDIDDTGDNDGDGIINSDDNCINTPNPDQADSDNNGIGDVCQDTDGDGVLDSDDNCPNTSNANQTDSDGDGIGDACEDADGDGVADGEDNCPETANPNQEDANNNTIGDLCDTSYEDPQNISLEVIAEACEGQDNGEIIINVVETFVDYTVAILGSGINQSQAIAGSSLTLDNLPVGAYTVCVSVDGRDFEQCFEINIDSAESLDAVFSVANNNGNSNGETSQTTSVNIQTGTAPFTASFNGEVVSVSSSRTFEVVTTGEGLLEITSAKECEGLVSQLIQMGGNRELSFGPNPVSDILNINLPNTQKSNLPVFVYDITGKQVYGNTIEVENSNKIHLSFTRFGSGVYFVQLGLEEPQTIKIIKK